MVLRCGNVAAVATTLRERKKIATRQALYEAVLRLALQHGLDNITVDAVADEANVSRRTFSNYFANKEDALLYGDQQRIARLLAEVRARPPYESAWQALTTGAMNRFADLNEVDQKFLAQLQLVRRHPTLLARQFATQAELERDLARELVPRLPDHSDIQARIMAATYLATIRVVLNSWIEQASTVPIGAAIQDGLARAGRAFP